MSPEEHSAQPDKVIANLNKAESDESKNSKDGDLTPIQTIQKDQQSGSLMSDHQLKSQRLNQQAKSLIRKRVDH